MRVTDAWIDDPFSRGEHLEPKLCVEVDELPEQTIGPDDFDGGWVVSKWGMFTRYWCSTGDVDAGAFNKRFSSRFPVMVDITLFQGVEDQSNEYCLPLTRARQLVRKHQPNWRLLMSDRAGINGQLLWIPVEQNPACKEYFPDTESTCGKRPTGTVLDGGLDKPLCSTHRMQHNARAAAKRTKATS